MRKVLAILLGAIAGVSILGLTTGGFPSQPTFQAVVIGAPTGGNKGVGSINVQSLFVNGAALAAVSPPVVCTATCSAAAIGVGQTYIIFKPSATSRNSTVTLTNDPDLIFTSVPVGRYEIGFALSIDDTASTTPGFQVGTVCTGTCVNTPVIGYQCISNQPSGLCGPAGGYNWPQAPALAVASGQTIFSMLMLPQEINVTVTGSLGISWAQNTSSASATIMNANTWLKLTRIL